jgi:predicted nucleic acid-binding protein
MAFVVDASVAATWMLPDEHNDAAERLIADLQSAPGLVPSLFWFEARNLFLMAERRGRVAAGEAVATMQRLRRLPLQDAGSGSDTAVLELAITHNLTPYDASYLALALDRKLPLATCDKRLAEAARREAIELVGPLAGS